MVFDLRGALLKKEEFESARLLDFEFRLRARATRRLAEHVGLPPDDLVRDIALMDEAVLLARVADRTGTTAGQVSALYARCQNEERARLIAERGDPTPYKLA